MRKKRAKRGFSIAEAILAMTLVVMISGVGYLSCVVATRIRANAFTHAKGYRDAELFRTGIYSAMQEVGDPENKDEFVKDLWAEYEWYFEADGLYAAAVAHSADEEAWTEEVPILKKGEEVTRSISVTYLGVDDGGAASYCYVITVSDKAYTIECTLNCRTEEYGGTITAKRSKSYSNFYEESYNFEN